jgi:hypothetical protein
LREFHAHIAADRPSAENQNAIHVSSLPSDPDQPPLQCVF